MAFRAGERSMRFCKSSQQQHMRFRLEPCRALVPFRPPANQTSWLNALCFACPVRLESTARLVAKTLACFIQLASSHEPDS